MKQNINARFLTLFLVSFIFMIVLIQSASVTPPITLTSSTFNSESVALASENISAAVTLSGDSTGASYDWYINGSSFLVANIPFDGAPNNTFYNDYSQSGNNLSFNDLGGGNYPSYNLTGGRDGNGAIEISGGNVNEFIRTTSDTGLPTGSSERTMMMWYYSTNSATDAYYGGYGGFSSNNLFYMRQFSGNYMLNAFGATDFFTGIGVTTNTWVHLAFVYNTTNILFYKDGVFQGMSSPVTLATTSGGNNGLRLGTIGGSTSAGAGAADDLRVYSKALTANQIKNIYDGNDNLIDSSMTNNGEEWSLAVTPFNNTNTTPQSNYGPTAYSNNNITVSPQTPGIQQGINLTLFGNPGTNPILANFTSYFNYSNPAQLGNHYTFLDIGNDGLMWYRFQRPSSNQSSLQSNNLIFRNGAFVNISGQGVYGDFLQLDGTGDDAIITDPSLPRSAYNDFTISAWVNTNSVSGIGRVMAVEDISADGWRFGRTGDELRFTTVGTLDYDTTGVNLATDTWYHVAVVFNSTFDADFYVNGVFHETINGGSYSRDANNVWTVGSAGGTEKWNGELDEILLINRTLQADEIASLYNATANQYYSFHNLSIGSHTLTGYAVNSLGGLNQTGYVTVAVNNLTLTSINLTDAVSGSNTTASPNNNIVVAGDVRGNETADPKIFYNWYVNGTSIMKSYIPMDGINASKCIDYAAVTQHDCTVQSTGAIQYTPNLGFNGRGTFNFDGDDYININPDMNTKPHESWTASIWFNSTVDSGSDQIMFSDGGTEGTRNLLHMGIRANGDYFCDLFGDAVTATGQGIEGDKQWHHAACSFDASDNNLSLFLDGNLVASTTSGGGLDANGESLIGARNAGPTGFWNGHLDEFTFWNRSLTPSMVAQLASNTGINNVIVSEETVDGENWTAYGTPNDNTENNTIALGTNSFASNTINITSLQDIFVNTLQPNGGNEEVGELMNISANVTTYTGNITLVQANITAPNGTSYIVNLSNLTNNQFDNNYSGEFNVSAILGQFNYTITVTGNDSGLNNTENDTFIGVDTTPPLLNNITPANLTEVNLTTNLTISVNATDVINVSEVSAFMTYPNGTEITLPFVNNSMARFNLTFNMPQQIGNYTYHIFANDTSGNENDTFTLWIQAIDVDAPNVTGLIPQNYTTNVNQSVLISANITDEIHVNNNSVFVNVSYPNGTTLDYQLSNTSIDLYNLTFNDTEQIGTYNISIWAIDTSGNVNNTETGNFTVSTGVCGVIDRTTSLTGDITDSISNCLNITEPNVILDCGGNTINNTLINGTVIRILADNVTINNCRVINTAGTAAIGVNGAGAGGGANINNSYFETNDALTISNLPLGLVQNSVFIGHSVSFNAGTDGIFVDNSVTLTSSATLQFSDANNISRNTINSTGTNGGIRLLSGTTTIEDNVISSPLNAIWVDAGTGYTIRRNSLSLDAGGASNVLALDTAGHTISENNFSKTEDGDGWVDFVSVTSQTFTNTRFKTTNVTLLYPAISTSTDITGTSLNFTAPDTVTVNSVSNPDLNVTASIQLDNSDGSVVVVDRTLNDTYLPCTDFTGLCSNIVFNETSRKLTFDVSHFSAFSGNASILNVTTVLFSSDPLTLTLGNDTQLNVTYNVSTNVVLDFATAACTFNHPVDGVKNSGCKNTGNGSNSQFVCESNFSWYDAPGNQWEANCSIESVDPFISYNTSNLTVNNLIGQNSSTSYNWSSIVGGSTSLANSGAVTLQNIGNMNLTTLLATGSTLSSGANTIPASSFFLNDVSSTTGGIALSTGEVNYSTKFNLPRGPNSLELVYSYLTVPGGQGIGNYVGDAWVFEVGQ